jgi:hypothetical protein
MLLCSSVIINFINSSVVSHDRSIGSSYCEQKFWLQTSEELRWIKISYVSVLVTWLSKNKLYVDIVPNFGEKNSQL